MANATDLEPIPLGKSENVGVMLDWIGDYQRGVLSGALDGAKVAGTGLLCFVGAQIPKEPNRSVRHRSFDLISRNNVEGLVVLSSTLIHQIGKEALGSYLMSRFPNLPKCSIGVSLPGIPSITSDNAHGIHEAMLHLAREHGYRRIAFIRGPKANEEAESRHQAYIEALKELELHYDERIVFEGNFISESGKEAVRTFAKIPGMRLEDVNAILASNDNMAIGALEALAEKGIDVPATIAVVGFDDIEEGALSTPSLSTVRQSLSVLGRQALTQVLNIARTGTTPAEQKMATQLVLRRSCGCIGQFQRTDCSVVPELEGSFEVALLMRRQKLLDKLTRVAKGELVGAGKDWQGRLLNAFVADVKGESNASFAGFIEDLASKLYARGIGLQPCYDIVDCLRVQLRPTMRRENVRSDRADELFFRAYNSVTEIAQRALSRERFRLGRLARELAVTCNSLSSASSLEELRLRIEHHLPKLGLDSYFVVTYRQDGSNLADLLVAREHQKPIASPQDNGFTPDAILPTSMNRLLKSGRAFVVLPLAHGTKSLGHLLIELSLEHCVIYDNIADAIAIGLIVSRAAC